MYANMQVLVEICQIKKISIQYPTASLHVHFNVNWPKKQCTTVCWQGKVQYSICFQFSQTKMDICQLEFEMAAKRIMYRCVLALYVLVI